MNFWAGTHGNCFCVGEEHCFNYCVRICTPDGELPSFGDIKDAYEDVIERGFDAAGIAVPAVVIVAIAYILAGLTVKPPTGVPV